MLVLAINALAGQADGVWQTSYTTTEGQTRLATLTLKTEGQKLTGTLVGPSGNVPITSGKILGDLISFTVLRTAEYDQVLIKFTGRIDGDTMTLAMQLGDRKPIAMTAKRSS